jgi:isopentenyl diphosphate isomerase/L-lactate dehydrogenase-like FMN-dependent dehydrogenase
MKNKNFQTIRQAEALAKKKIRTGTFEWLQAGVEDNYTRDKNILDLQKLKIIPRHLSGIKKKNITCKIFGKKIRSPLILSPMGHQTQFHYDGEAETAKAFNNKDRLSFFSTQGRISLEDIRKNNSKAHIGWEIFPFGPLQWIKNEIKKAEKLNCFSICICIDANIRSHRYQDREINYDARKYGRRTNPLPINPKIAINYDWSLISWIKKNSKLPIIIKGIISKDDALEAIKRKADAIWISNHGGRMFNSGISSLEAIRDISEITKNKTKIIVDGGVRKGSDIIKYLCAGADLVGIGRPAIYGLILDGAKGTKKIFEILESEMETAMINGGFKNLQQMKKNRFKK